MVPNDRDPQTYAIIGAAMEVHTHMGCGFSEPVYYEPFEFELVARNVPFERNVELPIIYKGRRMKRTYRADYICFGEIVVELKALSMIGSIEEAQLINYIRAADVERGLLINFGARSLQYKRRVWRFENDTTARPKTTARHPNIRIVGQGRDPKAAGVHWSADTEPNARTEDDRAEEGRWHSGAWNEEE